MGQIPLPMLVIKDHPQKTGARAKECLDPIDTALTHPYVMDRSGRAEGMRAKGLDY